MNSHLFACSDGALYDTRDPQWSHKPPLRRVYNGGQPEIRTTQDFKAALRNGAYAWPGGYPLYFICSDGAPLCFSCGRSNLREILSAIDRKDGSGWRVLATDINYEDNDLHCEHCSEPIESAYGED